MMKRAVSESGGRLQDKPELARAFNSLPNRLDLIEDMIHELRAQAEACVGTNQSVGVVRSLHHTPLCGDCLCPPLQVVNEYQEREKKIAKLTTQVQYIVAMPTQWIERLFVCLFVCISDIISGI